MGALSQRGQASELTGAQNLLETRLRVRDTVVRWEGKCQFFKKNPNGPNYALEVPSIRKSFPDVFV